MKLEIIEDNQEFNYRIYQSNIIQSHLDEIITDIDRAYHLYSRKMNTYQTTWNFSFYNIFSITAPSKRFYELYKELRWAIRDFVGDDRQLYLESWMNYHFFGADKILDWHNHGFKYHGYISVCPQKTITNFRHYSIENQIGNIYIGPGFREHRVEIVENYNSPRITLGFDVEDNTELLPMGHFSLIPLV